MTPYRGDEPVFNEPQAGRFSNYRENGLLSASYHQQLGDEDPTPDELSGPNALRRVSAPIPWAVYTVAFVELCERFSYYGTQILCSFCLKIPKSSLKFEG